MQMCGETFDNLGNPCKYKGSVIEWKQGRLMRTYGSKTYKYDASGIRTEKVSNGTTYKYYTIGGEIQSETRTQNGVTTKIWYYYDKSGICGIEYNGTEYYFQKDIQGDVVRIVNGVGQTVARYVYDAWGNHKVLNGSGAENTSETFIGNINPIRYRGYYYDTDTGFYYLKTRYYDPEVGRFINADDITYVDPSSLASCDLYGYCGNNPVMYVDPTGHLAFIFSFLIAVAAGAFFGGIAGGLSALQKGDKFLGGVVSGALIGGALGGSLVLGGATMLTIAGKTVTGFITASTTLGKFALGIGMTITAFNMSMVAGAFGYAIYESMNGRQVDIREMIRQGINTGIKGVNAFIVGGILGTTGIYNNLLASNTVFKFGLTSIVQTIKVSIIRSIISTIFQFNWRQGLQ